MDIILIAAMASNRVIGRDNKIPWHLPGEQRRFREVTWGHTIIMGRRTHESIGRLLPGRRNIVITRNPHYRISEGCEAAASLDQAYSMCRDDDRVFNIGGEQLYCQGIHDAHLLLLSVLHQPVSGDAYFPEFSTRDFQLVRSENIDATIPYSIQTFQRIRV